MKCFCQSAQDEEQNPHQIEVIELYSYFTDYYVIAMGVTDMIN